MPKSSETQGKYSLVLYQGSPGEAGNSGLDLTTYERNPYDNASRAKAVAAPSQLQTPHANDERNYLIMASILSSPDLTIARTLSLSPLPNLPESHQVLQITFDWTDSYAHAHVFNLHIPWDDRRFPSLVALLQPMEHGIRYVGFRPEPQDEKKWTLRNILEREEWENIDGAIFKGQIQLRYMYDMGDG
ncbi:MAG: hypothetical protein Q9178_007883 [Gyalolechia marmorata]